jgi:serine/threonine-protein kinase RsbW
VTEETTAAAVAATAPASASSAKPASASPGSPPSTTAASANPEAPEARAQAKAPAGPATTASQPSGEILDQVTVRMPADGAYLSVLRTATAGLAARLDFTLDEIEDLRIAVDEACAMLLSQAIPGTSLECSFALGNDDMTISVSVPSLNPRPPSGDTFAWTVLSALAGSVEAQTGPGDKLAIVMRKSRPNPGSV